MKTLRLPWIAILLCTALLTSCTDTAYDISESIYFSKVMPADYRGGWRDFIAPKSSGGYGLGNGDQFIEVNEFGNDVTMSTYPGNQIIYTANGWYESSIDAISGNVFLVQWNDDLRAEKRITFKPEGIPEPFTYIRSLDVTPDGSKLILTLKTGVYLLIILMEGEQVVWEYQLPAEMSDIQLRDAAAFFFGTDAVELLVKGETEDTEGLYVIDLSISSGTPTDIRPADTDLTEITRIWRVGDNFVAEGWDRSRLLDEMQAIAMLGKGFRQYRYLPLQRNVFRNVMVSPQSGDTFLLTDPSNKDGYQTLDQFNIQGDAVNTWQIGEQAFLRSVVLEETGDFLILGQLDYSDTAVHYFVRARPEDPFVFFTPSK